MADTREPRSGDVELARTFADTARTLLAEESVQATLDKICALALDTIDGCDHAAVSVVEGRKVTTQASTDDVPCRVDAIQYELDAGPCLDAIREHEVFEVEDLAADDRWPDFSRRAVEETRIHSMLSIRLFAEEHTMGALNLYSEAPAAFDADARDVGSVFAAHAAVAMVDAREREQFEQALASRDVIGRAKGILMARQNLTDDEAFDLLRRASQRMNLKLRDVAARIADPAASDPI